MVTKTPSEIAEMQALIDQGELPRTAIKDYFDGEARNVFGHDAKKTRKGEFVEQGIGSPQNMTRNSIEAYKKYCNPNNPKATDPDPNFTENLKKMEADLTAANERRKKEAA